MKTDKAEKIHKSEKKITEETSVKSKKKNFLFKEKKNEEKYLNWYCLCSINF